MRRVLQISATELPKRLAVVALAAGLSACSASPDAGAPGKPVGANEAAGQCRAQAISDTTSLLGPAAEATRDRLFKRCMAARGY